jgi:hypothetical protein
MLLILEFLHSTFRQASRRARGMALYCRDAALIDDANGDALGDRSAVSRAEGNDRMFC